MVLRSDSAVLIYLWGDDPRAARWLRQQLDMALRARSRRVLPAAVDNEAGFVDALNAVLAPQPGCSRFGVWVDLPADVSAWPLADQWLARVNERRQQLLQWPRPVIVCGPWAYEARAGEVAPDLWSVRSSSSALPGWPDVAAPAAGIGAASSQAKPDGVALSATNQPAPALLRLWQQAWAAASGQDTGKRLDLDLGLAAAEQLINTWQLEAADQVIAQVDQYLARLPEADAPLAQRQKLRCLGLQGELAVRRRHWPAAEAAFQAALLQAERLVKLTGESPEALRDWSVSLEKVGDVQRAMGDAAGARARYEQSLEVSERLVKLTDESPEALRDWSVSLNKVGDVQRTLGDVAGARLRYQQSLELHERLVKLTDESPEALRDWSASLVNVGDVQRAMGDLAGARARYQQSLELRERLVKLTGESPEALRDWSASLHKVGDVQRALGDVAGARARYQQSLQVSERLAKLTDESPEALRDWSISLIKVGDAQRASGDVAGARARYEQCLGLCERLVKLTGESPEALRDMAISLERLGDISRDQGKAEQARDFFTRDLQVAEAALRQSPLSQDIQRVVEGAKARLAALPPAQA